MRHIINRAMEAAVREYVERFTDGVPVKASIHVDATGDRIVVSFQGEGKPFLDIEVGHVRHTVRYELLDGRFPNISPETLVGNLRAVLDLHNGSTASRHFETNYGYDPEAVQTVEVQPA